MPNTTLHFSMQIAQYNKFYMFSLPVMISLPTGLAGSERITSASFKLASNGLEGGTLPNGYPCTPSEGGGGNDSKQLQYGLPGTYSPYKVVY